MPKAIRIDRERIITAPCHYDAIARLQASDALDDAAVDAMLDAGRIEFGLTYISYTANPDGSIMFENSETRQAIYISMQRINDFG